MLQEEYGKDAVAKCSKKQLKELMKTSELIKEWEEKFDRDQKLREQEEIRREQRLMQKELEKRAKFETVENDKENPRGLEKFHIDKSKEN